MYETSAGHKRVQIKTEDIKAAAANKYGKGAAEKMFTQSKSPTKLVKVGRKVENEEPIQLHEERAPEGEFQLPEEVKRQIMQQKEIDSFIESHKNDPEIYKGLKRREEEYKLLFSGGLILSMLEQDAQYPESLAEDLDPEPEVHLDPENFARIIKVKNLLKN